MPAARLNGDAPSPISTDHPSTRKRNLSEDETDDAGDDVASRKRQRPARYTKGEAEDDNDTAEHSLTNGNGNHINGHTNPAKEASPPHDPVEINPPAETPVKRKPGRPKGSKNRTPSKAQTLGRWSTITTSKPNGLHGLDTPRRRDLADRSARRKSTRALIDRVVSGAVSDDEAGDNVVAREIYQSSDDEDGDTAETPRRPKSIPPTPSQPCDDNDNNPSADPITPIKRRPGRPKGSGKKPPPRRRSPTPPPHDLPPHERYFFHSKPGTVKTSNNRLALDLLTHDEYFSRVRAHTNPHSDTVAALRALHAESFGQWAFELAQGFSLCLHGYGSKRALLLDLAGHLHRRGARVVVVNGYVRASTLLKDALSAMARAVDSTFRLPATTPVAMLHGLFALLSANPAVVLAVIVHSIDSPSLRKTSGGSGGSQSIFAQLAAHPQVRLACSADGPDFSLLWDATQRSLLNFAFHDCTTFAPPSAAELDVVDEVHELLGRRARRVGGKDGVVFVLRSLPENARSLFRLLVTEALVAMDEDGVGGGEHDGPAVEYRMLYNKAVEEFICSSEMAFRTLLKEFHDHQIITNRKDALGTELLCLPFRKDELESILEDLMS